MPQQPRVYADIAGNFRRGAGRTYASQGDFDRAIAIDADNADTYAGLQDRRERREREQTTRSGQEALTRAVATNDYRGAENVAAKMGDPTALASVRTMRTQFDDTQRTEAYRRGQRLVADLEGIQGLPQDQQASAYGAIRNREIEAARADGADPSSVDAILPASFSPMAVGAARGRANAMLRAMLDPNELVEMERDQRRLDIQDRQADISERRADAAEMTALAAMRRAEQAGGDGGISSSAAFTRANSLRDEYNQQTANYRTIADIAARSEAYANRVAANPSAASGQADVGLVYALAKIYDPTSVVREGEFATMARQGGYGEQMRSWVNQALGRGFSAAIRAQILAEIRNGVTSARSQRDQTRERYVGLAQQSQIDPSMVIDDYQASGSPGAGAEPPKTSRVANPTYDPNNPATWTREQRQQWLRDNPQ